MELIRSLIPDKGDSWLLAITFGRLIWTAGKQIQIQFWLSISAMATQALPLTSQSVNLLMLTRTWIWRCSILNQAKSKRIKFKSITRKIGFPFGTGQSRKQATASIWRSWDFQRSELKRRECFALSGRRYCLSKLLMLGTNKFIS